MRQACPPRSPPAPGRRRSRATPPAGPRRPEPVHRHPYAGGTGRVDPYSSTTAGPATSSPAPRSGRSHRRCRARRRRRTPGGSRWGRPCRCPARPAPAARASSGPTPVRRTFTHSTPCWGRSGSNSRTAARARRGSGRGRLGQAGVDHPAGRRRLERLAVVAQVGRAEEPLGGGVEPSALRAAAASDSRPAGPELGQVGVVLLGHGRADVVDADVHREQAPGAQVAGVGRDDRGGQVEDVEQAGGLQRPDPPKAHSARSRTSMPRRTVAWRMALAWFQVQISTMPSAHASGLRPTARPGRRSPPGRRRRRRDLAPEQVGRDAPEDQGRVGERGLGAAPAVAQRPGIGAGRARPTLSAPRATPRPPTRPGAHGHDVDHGDLGREAADGGVGGERGRCRPGSRPRRSRCPRRG